MIIGVMGDNARAVSITLFDLAERSSNFGLTLNTTVCFVDINCRGLQASIRDCDLTVSDSRLLAALDLP